jgi:hypothetical protein
MKTHCHRTISLIVMILLASLLFSTTALAEIGFMGKVGVVINNKAVFRGMETMPGTDFQGVTIAGIDMHGAGPGVFTLGILSKYSHDMSKDEGLKNKRNDVTLAYTLPLLDKKLFLTVGHTSYLFSKSTTNNINLNEAFVAAKFNVFLKPTFHIYYDYESDDNGLFYTAKISKGFKVAKGLKLGLSALVSYNDESTVKMRGLYTNFHNAEAGASLNWAATKQLTISPHILASIPLSDDAEDIGLLDDEFRYGVKMLVKF